MTRGPLRVLFVCRENACRSQMAEAWARSLCNGQVEAFSAGSQPRGRVDETATQVMAERGIDLALQRSKGLDQLPPGGWDLVVSMGCGDACPQVPARRRAEWAIPDPAGQPLEVYRQVRDQIEQHVRSLA
jgi:protein-tyrosine-phosphatase